MMPGSFQGRPAVSDFPGSPTPPGSLVSAHQPPCRSKKGCRVPAPCSCGRSVPVLVSGCWQCHPDEPTLPLPWSRVAPLHPGLLVPDSRDLGSVHASVPHSSRGKRAGFSLGLGCMGRGWGPSHLPSLKMSTPFTWCVAKATPLLSGHKTPSVNRFLEGRLDDTPDTMRQTQGLAVLSSVCLSKLPNAWPFPDSAREVL